MEREAERGRGKLAWHFVNQFLLEYLALYATSELHFVMEIEKFHKATLAVGWGKCAKEISRVAIWLQ